MSYMIIRLRITGNKKSVLEVFTKVYDTRDCLVFGHCPALCLLKNMASRKLDPFPSLRERVRGTYSVGSRVNHWTQWLRWALSNGQFLPPPYLWTETDAVSRKLCSVMFFTILDDGQCQNLLIPGRENSRSYVMTIPNFKCNFGSCC
jgi:hypothetical protein